MRTKRILLKYLASLCLLVLSGTAVADAVAAQSAADKPAKEPVIDRRSAALHSLEAEGMVVIPAGRFTMGSTPAETSRENVPDLYARNEYPKHEVQVRSFALAKYDVTRGQYAEFVRATGYSATGCIDFDRKKFEAGETGDWQHPGFRQTDRDPVVCIDYADAEAYIQWYSAKTGHAYRLPTEAEWEYAARAGTTTSRYWGDAVRDQCRYANGGDQTYARQFPSDHDVNPVCADGYAYTSPVGTFQPNALGLYDMLGNVWQWTEDCWTDGYDGAPADGSAWTTGNCEMRVIRGGSWDSGYPWILRSAHRVGFDTGMRFASIGFRLARTLPEGALTS